MSSQMRVVMTGDEQKLFQSLQNIINQSNKADDSFAKNAKTSTEAEKAALRAAKAQAKSAREGAKLADELSKKNESLNDSYRRRKAAIEAAGAAGVKSEEEVRVAVGRLKKAVMEEARVAKQAETEKAESARKGTKAYKDQQDEIRKGITKVNQLKAANKTLDQQYDELRMSMKAAFKAGKLSAGEYKTSLRQLGVENDRLKKSQKSTFGAGSIKQIGAYAASFLTIAGAIAVVRRALEFFNEEKEKALGTTDSLVDVRRSLRQVSKGDFDQLESRSDDLTKFGIDRVQARKLVFDARSTGFEGEEATVAKANPVISIEDGAAFAGEFRKFFAGDNLSIEQSFNTALAGAANSKFNITEILPQIRTAAQGQIAGGESSDVVAAVGVLADKLGKSTGDRIRALGIKLATNDETKGLNLIEGAKKLIDNPQLRKDIVKDSSELKAVMALFEERMGLIVASDKRIEKEQQLTGSAGLIGKKVREATDTGTDAGVREMARQAAIAARQAELISLEGDSAAAYAQKRFVSEEIKYAKDNGSNGVMRFATSAAAKAGTYTGLIDGNDLLKQQQELDRRVGERSEAAKVPEKQLTEAEKQTVLLQEIAEKQLPFQPSEADFGFQSNRPLSKPGVDQ